LLSSTLGTVIGKPPSQKDKKGLSIKAIDGNNSIDSQFKVS